MAIIKTSQFVTSDGAIFATAKEANAAEARLELVALVGVETLASLEVKYELRPKRVPRKSVEEKAVIAAVTAAVVEVAKSAAVAKNGK